MGESFTPRLHWNSEQYNRMLPPPVTPLGTYTYRPQVAVQTPRRIVYGHVPPLRSMRDILDDQDGANADLL